MIALKSKFKEGSYYERLEIVKKHYSNRQYSGLDYDSDVDSNDYLDYGSYSSSNSDSYFELDSISDRRSYSDLSEEGGMKLYCNHYMIGSFKVY